MRKCIIILFVLCLPSIVFAQKNNQGKPSLSGVRNQIENAKKALDDDNLNINNLQAQIDTAKSFLLSAEQQVKQLETIQKKAEEAKTVNVSGKAGNLTKNIVEINEKIANLKKEIGMEYDKYAKEKFYSDKNYQTATFDSLDKDIKSLERQIKAINDSVAAMKKENDTFMEKLKYFYSDTNIENLYGKADLVSLEIHRTILGRDYPKVMDELIILLQCSNSFSQKYNEKENSQCLQQLKSVRQCNLKDSLEYLLLSYKEVSDEVENWKKSDREHSLYSMMSLLSYVKREYNRQIDKEYPYLFASLRESVVKK